MQDHFLLDYLFEANLSAASYWIGVQTGIHGLDYRTQHKLWFQKYLIGESLWLPAICTLKYPIFAYKWKGAMSVMFPFCMAPGPHSSISEEFLHYSAGLRRP